MTRLNPHDDVEYKVNVQVEGQKEPLTMQVFTSRKYDVASRHIARIIQDHNDRNGEGTMTLVSADVKDSELRASLDKQDAKLNVEAAAQAANPGPEAAANTARPEDRQLEPVIRKSTTVANASAGSTKSDPAVAGSDVEQ